MRRTLLAVTVIGCVVCALVMRVGAEDHGKLAPGLATPATQANKPVDLLTLVKSANDIVGGEWRAAADGLRCQATGGNRARIRLPYVPPSEYDLAVDFAKLDDSDAVVCVMLTHKGHPFNLVLGALKDTIAGFERIKGEEAARNTTATSRPHLLGANKPHRVAIHVREDSIVAVLDETVTIGPLSTNYQDLSVTGDWWVGDGAIGLGANCKALFHSVVLTGVSGPGQASAWPPVGAIPAMTDPLPDEKPHRVIDLMKLVDLKQQVLMGAWTFNKEGALVGFGPWLSRIRFPYQPPEEYDLAVEFSVNAVEAGGSADTFLIAPVGGKTMNWCLGTDWNSRCELSSTPDNKPLRLPGLLRPGRRYKAVLSVRQDYVYALLDGQMVLKHKRTKEEQGFIWESYIGDGMVGLGATAGTTFYQIQVGEITGEGKVPAPAPPLFQPKAVATTVLTDRPARVLNLLKKIDVELDMRQGLCDGAGDGLHCQVKEGCSMLRTPYLPGSEYNLHVEFTHGSEMWPSPETAIIFPFQGHDLALHLGAHANTICGIEQIGQHPWDSDESPSRIRSAGVIADQKRCSVTLYVRRDRISVIFNGAMIIDFPVDADTARSGPWPTNGTIQFRSYKHTIYHVISLEEISADGKEYRR